MGVVQGVRRGGSGDGGPVQADRGEQLVTVDGQVGDVSVGDAGLAAELFR
jgi:hypothetical protein